MLKRLNNLFASFFYFKQMAKLKSYTVIYLPHGREDKEWLEVEASSTHQIKKEFKSGLIISIDEN